MFMEFRREFPRPPYGRSYEHREVQHNIAVLAKHLEEAGITSLVAHLRGYNDEGSITAVDIEPEGAVDPQASMVSGMLDLSRSFPPKPKGTTCPPMALEDAVYNVCFDMIEHSNMAGWETGDGSNIRMIVDPQTGVEAWWIDSDYDMAFEYASFAAVLDPSIDRAASNDLPEPSGP